MNKYQLQSETKSSGTAFLFWFFLGAHYAYLGKWGVQCAYCFDALYCNPEDEEIVREVMNAEASKMGIKTTA